jgi:hypothetical protein
MLRKLRNAGLRSVTDAVGCASRLVVTLHV